MHTNSSYWLSFCMCTWYWFIRFISLYVPWSKDGFLFPSAGSLGDFFHDLNSWEIPELEVCRWEDHQSSSIFKREKKHITINYIINVPYLNFPYINHQSIPGAVGTSDVGRGKASHPDHDYGWSSQHDRLGRGWWFSDVVKLVRSATASSWFVRSQLQAGDLSVEL